MTISREQCRKANARIRRVCFECDSCARATRLKIEVRFEKSSFDAPEEFRIDRTEELPPYCFRTRATEGPTFELDRRDMKQQSDDNFTTMASVLFFFIIGRFFFARKPYGTIARDLSFSRNRTEEQNKQVPGHTIRMSIAICQYGCQGDSLARKFFSITFIAYSCT